MGRKQQFYRRARAVAAKPAGSQRWLEWYSHGERKGALTVVPAAPTSGSPGAWARRERQSPLHAVQCTYFVACNSAAHPYTAKYSLADHHFGVPASRL